MPFTVHVPGDYPTIAEAMNHVLPTDTIVLDGGVTPQGAAILSELGQDIADNYDRVYSAPAGTG